MCEFSSVALLCETKGSSSSCYVFLEHTGAEEQYTGGTLVLLSQYSYQSLATEQIN